MKIVKKIVLVIMSVLLLATIIMLSMGAWMPVIAVGTGFIFIYYLIVYILIKFTEAMSNKIFNYIIYFLVFAPLVWIVVDAEGIIDSFTDYALKGYRYQI